MENCLYVLSSDGKGKYISFPWSRTAQERDEQVTETVVENTLRKDRIHHTAWHILKMVGQVMSSKREKNNYRTLSRMPHTAKLLNNDTGNKGKLQSFNHTRKPGSPLDPWNWWIYRSPWLSASLCKKSMKWAKQTVDHKGPSRWPSYIGVRQIKGRGSMVDHIQSIRE